MKPPADWTAVSAKTKQIRATASRSVGRVRAQALRAALEAANGNITHAAVALKVNRVHVAKLVKRLDLTEFAAGLRVKSGGAARGRPWPKSEK
jgi:transcriptional regulator with GAF, ATPase, and Fis domain